MGMGMDIGLLKVGSKQASGLRPEVLLGFRRLFLVGLGLLAVLQLAIWSGMLSPGVIFSGECDLGDGHLSRIQLMGSTPRVPVEPKVGNETGPLLVLHVQHGLSNRIRALLSGMAIARATGRRLQVLWIPDTHIMARFQDLFDNRLHVWERLEDVEGRPDWAEFDRYNYMENEEGAEKYKYINESSPRNIYVKSAYILRNKFATMDQISKEMNTLVPTEDVRRSLSRFRTPVCHGWRPCMSYVGVHVRNADPHTELGKENEDMYTQESWHLTDAWRRKSTPEHFVSELQRLLAAQPDLWIFVSADNEASLEPFVETFGSRVVYLDKRGCFDRSPACIKIALADLMLLGHSSHQYILGSYWSSFTEVASYARSLPVRFAGVDFRAPGTQSLPCGQTSFGDSKSTPTFDDVAVVVAVQDQHAALRRSLPTWLAAEGVAEVVVVDWGSSPPLSIMLAAISDRRLRVIRVVAGTPLTPTRAFNLGFRHTSSRRILKVDADVQIHPSIFTKHPLEPRNFYAGKTGSGSGVSERSVFFAHRDDIREVNGFDERIDLEGGGDEDLLARLEKIGARRSYLEPSYFRIVHDNTVAMPNSKEASQMVQADSQRTRLLVEQLPPWAKNPSTTKYSCQDSGAGTCQCTVASEPLGIEDSLPASVVDSVTVQAYRDIMWIVAQIEGRFLDEANASSNWYKTFLRRHLLPSDLLVLKAEGTIPERLVAIQCSQQLAATWRRPLQVIWTPDPAVKNARFEELFQTKDVDVVSEFHEFEVTDKYIALRLDVGTTWLPDSYLPPEDRMLFLRARGAFGPCNSSISNTTIDSLNPTALAQEQLEEEGSIVPPRPVLFVRIRGSIAKRFMSLAASFLLAKTVPRHVVIVWDPQPIGGLRVKDLFAEMVQEVESTEAYFEEGGDGDSEAGVVDRNSVTSLKEIDWGVEEHILLDASSRVVQDLEWSTQTELSRAVKELKLSQEVVDQMMDLQVGKGFHGVLFSGNWSNCGKQAAFQALKDAYAKEQSSAPYFLLLVEEAHMCPSAGPGVICVPICSRRDMSKACLLRHLAAVMVLPQLPRFFFFDWGLPEAELVIRRKAGEMKERMLECSAAVPAGPASRFVRGVNAMSLVRENSTGEPCGGAWNLILQLRAGPAKSEPDFALREREYWDTLQRNLQHPEVKKIHLLIKTQADEAIVKSHMTTDTCQKLTFHLLGRDALHSDIFNYANENLQGELCASIDSDIFLGEGFYNHRWDALLPVNRMLALSHHGDLEHACEYGHCNRYRESADGVLSHSTFLFRSPVPAELEQKTGFGLLPGADNVLVHEMKALGMDVRNPCRSLRTYHNRCSKQQGDSGTTMTLMTSKPNQRLDTKICGTMYCGDGWVQHGPEVLEDLE